MVCPSGVKSHAAVMSINGSGGFSYGAIQRCGRVESHKLTCCGYNSSAPKQPLVCSTSTQRGHLQVFTVFATNLGNTQETLGLHSRKNGERPGHNWETSQENQGSPGNGKRKLVRDSLFFASFVCHMFPGCFMVVSLLFYLCFF